MRIMVLGCGFHGRGIAYQIAAEGEDVEMVAADKDGGLARRVAEKTGGEWMEVDVEDRAGLTEALKGIHTVFNATGPYHLLGMKVVDAAIATNTHYVDMADDHEMTEELLLNPEWGRRARQAGVAVLSGCGIMPGLSGVLARYGYGKMDEPRKVNIWFSWNYSLKFPSAIHHFLRINSGLAPQLLNGNYVKPGAFANRETIAFLPPVGCKEVYYTGVPDPVSIPQFLPGLTEVTASGGLHQPEGNDLMESMVRWGFTSYEKVLAFEQSPMEFLMAYLKSERGKQYFNIEPLDQPMAVRVRVKGMKCGKPCSRVFEAQDFSRRGTTSVAALATLMVASGEIEQRGIGSPEGWLDAGSFLRRMAREPGVELFELVGDEEARALFGDWVD